MYITGWTAALAAAGIVPAAWLGSSGIAWLWALGVLGLAMADAGAAPHRSSLGVRREVPGSVRLSEPTASTLVVANLGRRAVRGAVRDAWPPSAGAVGNRHRFSLRVGEASSFRTRLLPTRRGDRRAAGVTVRLEGPLRLAGRQHLLPRDDVLRVLPEFASRVHLPTRLARLRELDGQSSVQLAGAGAEFDSLREYVIGDDVRTIDWRGTARRGDVVVRTYRPERDRRVFILLDCSRLSAARVEDAPRLDAGIEAALLLAALASHAGDRVQVSAFDRSERARAAGATPAALMPKVADALAPIEPELVEPDWFAAVRLVQSRLSQRALVVVLTQVEASALDSGLLDAVRALGVKHQVLVAHVDDPELAHLAETRGSVQDAYAAAAAERSRLEAHAIAARLRQLGAEVVRSSPESLAPDVADTYLRFKGSGRL